jgi:hypothetical protein
MKTQEKERVRKNTSEDLNQKIDRKAISSLNKYSQQSSEIEKRLKELEAEWDIERAIQLNAGALALSGLILSTKNKKWLALSTLVTGFLVQHSIQGWCPPVPLFRALGYRTRQEIDQEKYALKALRGDFDNTYDTEDAWQAVKEK